MWNEGPMTFTANGAIGAKIRVKLTAASTTTPPQVEIAGAGEQHIGVTQFGVADGALVAVKGRSPGQIVEMTASEAIEVGDPIYGAAAGKVKDTSDGSCIGYAIEQATANGDIIQCIDEAILSTTAATVSVADSGEFTAAATVEAALAEIYQHLVTAQGTIPVPLGAITMEDGTALTKQATDVAGYAQLANKEIVIDIPINCSAGETLGFSVPVPQDLDDTADITVHVLAAKAADLDVLTLDCEVYNNGPGDLANADIQDTAAQTIVAAGTELVFTCGTDGVIAAPGVLSVVLILGGTNDGDAVHIHGAWIEYKKKILTA